MFLTKIYGNLFFLLTGLIFFVPFCWAQTTETQKIFLKAAENRTLSDPGDAYTAFLWSQRLASGEQIKEKEILLRATFALRPCVVVGKHLWQVTQDSGQKQKIQQIKALLYTLFPDKASQSIFRKQDQ